jgi:hypothetical protein
MVLNSILNLFGGALKNDGTKLLDFAEVNKIASKLGYFIPEELCNTFIMRWLESQKIDYNKTFYKEWNDIISKNRFELFIDQILHYMSTYGTGFQGEAYIPNSGVEVPEFKNMKVIKILTKEEVAEKVTKMLESGIALKEDTVKNLIDIIKELNIEFKNIDNVKNKEAKMLLCKELGIFPSKPEEFVRYLVYLTTGKTMVIKSKVVINTIKNNNVEVSPYIISFGVEKLSSIFYRYKDLFLAMRNTERNKVVINKLRRLADKYHTPYRSGYFENILALKEMPKNLEYMLKGLNNYKKIALLQTIKIRKKEIDIRAIVIRNQKLYLKNEVVAYREYYDELYDVIYKSLVESLSKKATSVKMIDGLNLVAPTSEKNFIGNIPIGSNYDISDKSSIVGIYWHEKDGAVDLDLSSIDISGNKIGWNSNYYDRDNNIIYSGDITFAPNGANEFIYCKKGLLKDMIIKVNAYRIFNDSFKFKMFIAKENIDDISNSRGYMIDPNNIVFQEEMVGITKENSLGVITNKKFVFANLGTGNARVSTKCGNSYIEYVVKTLDCYVDLKTLLVDAGFSFTKPEDEEFGLDLTKLDKSTLIELLA